MPHLTRFTIRLVTCLTLLIATAPARAAEPWADERMPVKDGLMLWLDASHQPTAARDGAAVAIWADGSGNRRHALQPAKDARPVYVRPEAGDADNSPAALGFDGADDCLLITGPHEPLDAVTLVLVAAPRSNAGFFRGMFAAAALGGNDYTSGLNVDLGPAFGARFDVLNVEGAGTVGAANLLHTGGPLDFGAAAHVLAVTSAPGPQGIALRVDGKPAGRRDRAAGSAVRLDQIAIGSRFYSNDPASPYVQGFFDGHVAEVLLFDRALPAGELASVEKYLADKYATLKLPEGGGAAQAGAAGTRKLVPVKDPPAVQVFAPGFTARRLPLELNNVNNLRYRPDGKLVAVGYDGNVHLLIDSDGDGLEDRATLFWDNMGRIQSPIGMALTPPGYPRGDGLFVAGKGKVSLIVDTDKDDVADEEIVVATGWPVLPHGVDALGVAIEPDGSVLFGLGTTNFTDAYLTGADGAAKYDLKSERGTVLRVSPDFAKREIVATGIRFPVALALNPAGDLFATDQEGATWLPNGNPFDELLHVQAGRHYGFPPRHPKHLPNVIDEPSVFDYRPQHQSTCGLAFNLPVNGGPSFGPGAWAGDAIVTGYSRGKLYRTQLVQTAGGYVARTHLIASMTTMPADACVSPAGDLVVAGHGGAPDWGSGPAGQGALYKLSYADKAKPQPLFAYAANSRELRVAFDRPLDPAALKGLAERASVEYGDPVAAGDRFEALRPGYEVVQRQLVAPRFGLDVHGVAVTPDRRTLLLQTAPMSRASTYAITLPGEKSEPDAGVAKSDKEKDNAAKDATSPMKQVDAIDLAADLSGAEATWTPGDGKGKPTWTGWLPHLDLGVAMSLTRGSAEHDALWAAMKEPGVLRLRAQLDLADMLRPVVQPGSRIDYMWPPETVTVTFAAGGAIIVKAPDGVATERADWKTVSVTVTEGDDAEPGKPSRAPVPLEISMSLAANTKPSLGVSWHTKEDPRPRALPLRRILLPWAKPADAASPTMNPDPSAEPQLPAELAGGSWAHGRTVYLSEQAMCGKCHVLHGVGAGKIGPDLSNLHHRDYASVLQDVLSPSAAINPDHVAYAITLSDGNVLAGVPRSDGDGAVIVGEPGGKETRVERSAIKTMEPLGNSIMPHGIDQTIGKDAVRDLMVFLMTPPLEPARLEIEGAPAPRTWAEVEAVLKASARPGDVKVDPAAKGQATRRGAEAEAPKPLHVVLAAGPKDHGPGEHDYPAWQRRWRQLLSRAENVGVETSFGWPEPKHFETADVIVFYSNNPGWGADKAEQLDAYLQRGGGLVYLHFAVDGHADPEILGARIGLAWRGGASKFRHGPLDLTFTDPAHPITRGFERAKFVDESYWQLIGDASKVHLLATGSEENAPRPLLWTHEPAGPHKGRVFVSIPGHYAWTFDDPLFRILLLRGIAWAGRAEDVDRLSDLATIGARIEAAGEVRQH
jgi:putative heme-binding domain-containing protein